MLSSTMTTELEESGNGVGILDRLAESENLPSPFSLVDYQFVRPGQPVRPQRPGLFYDYLVGSNGVFIRAVRPGLVAVVPVMWGKPIRGLLPIHPGVAFTDGVPKLPAAALGRMLEKARQAKGPGGQPVEILFHLYYDPTVGRWQLSIPQQEQHTGSVRPVGQSLQPGGSYEKALVELHSHHSMAAYFSQVDDRDEQGFRVYCVIGHIFRARPHISVRVGVYGHFYDLPADAIFAGNELTQFNDEYNRLSPIQEEI